MLFENCKSNADCRMHRNIDTLYVHLWKSRKKIYYFIFGKKHYYVTIKLPGFTVSNLSYPYDI